MEITKHTMLSDILEHYPEAIEVFQEVGMHCLGCAMASAENIEQACCAHGVDPDEFVLGLIEFVETI